MDATLDVTRRDANKFSPPLGCVLCLCVCVLCFVCFLTATPVYILTTKLFFWLALFGGTQSCSIFIKNTHKHIILYLVYTKPTIKNSYKKTSLLLVFRGGGDGYMMLFLVCFFRGFLGRLRTWRAWLPSTCWRKQYTPSSASRP